ncbi:catechol 1,2-dioxygenase [Microtetraspora fusca]|uniref:Catechol 1,2-dioxygenase n=1 Tax=Microtetraspora fusca TaxID=1997 RepID=A0ABW6VHR6_MICFU|nr:catechol 1,2-dioxygenase [Microtetraspora fusca]
MGEIVGAGILAHAPTVMLPLEVRKELNEGKEISIVPGLRRLREEVFDAVDYDTVIVFDSHWATTFEFVVTAQDRRSGLFTSEELPRGMCRIPYDFPGDPELARLIASYQDRHATWITAIDDHHLPIFYATVNLWKYLGVEGKRWISIGMCQTAETEDNLRLGRAVGEAVAASDRKVLLIASGALSHMFWPLRHVRAHESSDPSHVRTPEARAADEERIAWMLAGDHPRVLDTMEDFYRFKPEGRFGHYLMMAGALGEHDFTAPGRQYSDYENATGTGQVHVWFDRPEGGFAAPRATDSSGDPYPYPFTLEGTR